MSLAVTGKPVLTIFFLGFFLGFFWGFFVFFLTLPVITWLCESVIRRPTRWMVSGPARRAEERGAVPVFAPSPRAGPGWWSRCVWRRLAPPAPLGDRGRGVCRRVSLARSERAAKAAWAACPCRRRRRTRRRRISFARPISSCPRLCTDAESPQEGAVKAFNVQILQGRSEF